MLEANKEETFADIRLKQQEFLLIGEVEGGLELVDRGRRLLQEDLDRRVGDDRQTVRRLQEVVNVLRDGGETEVVFSTAFCQTK